MNFLICLIATVTATEKTDVIQPVVFDQRHAPGNDIDVVADCQINEAIADFFGILGQPADGL